MQYELFSQDLSSSKTSRGLLVQNSKGTGGKIQPEPLFCSMSSVNWKEWVTTRRQEYSVRLKSAHLIREKEFLSLAKSWPTPAARDVKGKSGKGRQERKGHPTDTLPNAVAVWPTPTAAEGSKIGSQANYGQVGLSNHPAIVGHPDREKLNKSGKSQELWATAKPQNWPTPQANEIENPNKEYRSPTNAYKGEKKVQPMLADVCKQNWPTPDTQNHRDGTVRRKDSYGSHGVSLHHKIAETNKPSMKLNPSWVEQLQGLPVGWTQLPTEWIDSDCSETELSRIPVK
jgi:hypothetical protein